VTKTAAPAGDPPAPGPAPERVLSTLNLDGSRRFLYPQPSPGRFLRARRILGWALIVLFVGLPFLTLNGKPAILLQFESGRFTFFGTTFFATDSALLMLGLLALFLAIFLTTALWGRIWCGWACPQPVYLELLFRPIERLLEGGPMRRRLKTRWARIWRGGLKHLVFAALSLALAHLFVAYFVGVDAIWEGVTLDSGEHPVAFGAMLVVTALMVFDFARFREQTCTVVCPYGRFQSVLLDRRSLIVGYDARRGEPRGKGQRTAETAFGDCIDCGACVRTCPTGIDIRDGLQMECIHCTQCTDACDAIMDRVGKPRGLVRYASQDELEGTDGRGARWRLWVYPALLGVALVAFVIVLLVRTSADVTLLRGAGNPFAVTPTGEITSQIRIKIANRTAEGRSYRIALVEPGVLRLIAPQNPFLVAAGRTDETSVFVLAPRSEFVAGRRRVKLHVADGHGFEVSRPYLLLGPQDGGGGSVR
jgi:cytochrome c oxidase accessory protein FixG